MKILLLHNKYALRGGEESVFEDEQSLLVSKGYDVLTYTRNNKETENYNLFQKILFPLNMLYSMKTSKDINKILKQEKPDIVHVHNFFPLISPSLFFACKKQKVPVVMTLHNFRLVGGNALLLRNGKINEESLIKRNPFLEVKHKSYRESFILTFLLALMLKIHKFTFQNKVTRYIALTNFNMIKYVQGGLPEHKISIKGNFTFMAEKPLFQKKPYAIFIGRLSQEKGVATLADSWKKLDFNLEVFGSGPEEHLLKNSGNVILNGYVSKNVFIKKLKEAQFLIFSSEWYETFGLAMIEAFSLGTPVLASKVGNMEYIITQNKTGRFFKMGDAKDLAKQAIWMFNHKKECEEMGRNAYAEYKEKYTAETNYKQLMEIYNKAIEENKKWI